MQVTSTDRRNSQASLEKEIAKEIERKNRKLDKPHRPCGKTVGSGREKKLEEKKK